MTGVKILKLAVIIIVFVLLTAWGIPAQANPVKVNEQVAQKTEQKAEKEKAEEQKEEDWMTSRMKEGESMFEILGIDEVMPTTFDLFLLWLLPALIIVALLVLIVIFSKRRHQRAMAMIEKGAYQDKDITKYMPKPYNWRLITALTGLVLVLGGIGLSLFMIGEKGIEKWHTGIIPLFVGVAFLIFHLVYFKNKE